MCRLCSVEFCACTPAGEYHLLPPMGEENILEPYFFHQLDLYVLLLFLGTTLAHRCPHPRELTDLKDVFMNQDDCLEGGSTFVGQLMESLLFAPALLQQGVTHHTWRASEARAEVESDIRARLGAAAARQVDLKPA